MTLRLQSPLREHPQGPVLLGNLRSPAFAAALKTVFLGALAERAGETIGSLASGKPKGVLGRYILTGLVDVAPYGDPGDATLGADAPLESLDARTVELILIAVLAAQTSELNLAFHMLAALQAGASLSQVEATLALVGRYAGAGTAMHAAAALRRVERAITTHVAVAPYTEPVDPRATQDAERLFEALQVVGGRP